MDPVLYDLLVTRLIAAGPADSEAESLVLTACEGPDALEAALRGDSSERRAAAAASAAAQPHAGVYLDSVTVEGFRGVGDPVTLSLSPFPSLTLVVGRNGSGKSTFAEALELLMTGRNRRWEGRSEIWKEGWRNLHHSPCAISADFIVEGKSGRTVVARTWPDGAGLAEGTTTIDGKPADGSLAALGWQLPLTLYRPFLPHNELGALWDEGPAKLHDALAAILGLEDVATLIRFLGEARLRRERDLKEVTSGLSFLRGQLDNVDDSRARACLASTAKRSWDLDLFEKQLDEGAGAAQPDLGLLRELAELPCPAAQSVADQVDRLRSVGVRLVAIEGTDAGRARTTAALLRAALDHVHAIDGTSCPVCGAEGTVGEEWQRATAVEIDRLAYVAADAEAVHRAAQNERNLAMTLIGHPPLAIRRARGVGIDTAELQNAWTAWATVDKAAASGVDALARHIESAYPALAAATASVRTIAATELARREDAWRPVAQAARVWLAAARPAVAAAARLPALKSAEAWVKDAEKRLRAERFAPIAEAVQTNWTALRQDSSVILESLSLEGTKTSRRVAMDVSIDGASGAALGVMSQGELNALALSLFLPRASLPESPFRFIVIDDPVQAMDPSKVDGLARVLEAASRTHQVVVFTHDERLPAATRRLGIEAVVIDVVRRENSVVEIREGLDPVRRHIQDAFAVANTDDLPISAGRVVPTFCRLALEAACSEVVIRRRLARGQPLADVEAILGASPKLTTYLSLALFDDGSRGNDVVTSLQNRWGQWAVAAFLRCRRGPHDEDTGDLRYLCEQSDRLARALLSLP